MVTVTASLRLVPDHRRHVRLTISVRAFDGVGHGLAVLRDHAPTGDVVLPIHLLCAESESICIHLFDGYGVIGRAGHRRFASIVLCDVAGIDRCVASGAGSLSGSGDLDPAVSGFPGGGEALDWGGRTELGFSPYSISTSPASCQPQSLRLR